MKRIATIIFFLVVVFNNFGFADNDGYQLLEDCGAYVNHLNSKDEPKDTQLQSGMAWCDGFLKGIMGASVEYTVEMPTEKRMFCPPGKETTDEMAKIIVKYLQEHPEILHEAHFVLAFKALRQAYPCINTVCFKRSRIIS